MRFCLPLQLMNQFFIYCLAFLCCQSELCASNFQPQNAKFAVHVKEDTISYRVFGVYALPGEVLKFTVIDQDPNSQFALMPGVEGIKKLSERSWHWQVSNEKMQFAIKIVKISPADSILLNVFVLVPFAHIKGEYLNYYRIGNYPANSPKKSPVYEIPRGFIQVTEANQETWISPHFKLKQFLCKQDSPFPRYVVIKERLLLLLERILEKTNQAGYRCDTFHIMSGYRTPFYNHAIGNVRYSCHLYGAAADFFIDENPRDDMMDDLNGDGKSDINDAAVLYDLIQKLSNEPWFRQFRGGLAKYEKTASHGPFVHVDVRGHPANWGQ